MHYACSFLLVSAAFTITGDQTSNQKQQKWNGSFCSDSDIVLLAKHALYCLQKCFWKEFNISPCSITSVVLDDCLQLTLTDLLAIKPLYDTFVFPRNKHLKWSSFRGFSRGEARNRFFFQFIIFSRGFVDLKVTEHTAHDKLSVRLCLHVSR